MNPLPAILLSALLACCLGCGEEPPTRFQAGDNIVCPMHQIVVIEPRGVGEDGREYQVWVKAPTWNRGAIMEDCDERTLEMRAKDGTLNGEPYEPSWRKGAK
jgi:hypothetical protein